MNREAHRHRGRARERVRGGSRGGKQGRHLVRPSSQLDLILPLSDGPRQQVSCSGGGARGGSGRRESPREAAGRVRRQVALPMHTTGGRRAAAAPRQPSPRTPRGQTAAVLRGGSRVPPPPRLPRHLAPDWARQRRRARVAARAGSAPRRGSGTLARHAGAARACAHRR